MKTWVYIILAAMLLLAPSVKGVDVIHETDFEDGLPPLEWIIGDFNMDGFSWYEDAVSAWSVSDPYLSGTAMVAEGMTYGVSMNDFLSLRIDCSGYSSVVLEFGQFFYDFGYNFAAFGEVGISINGGSIQTLYHSSYYEEGLCKLDLSLYAAGQSDVEIYWLYYDPAVDGFWMIDNVKVLGATGSDTVTISGQILDIFGVGIDGVTVSANNGGGSVLSESGGSYQLDVPFGWTGNVTPTKEGYGFSPLGQTYSIITENATYDYVGSDVPIIISGYALTSDLEPIQGVSVTASNGGGSGATDSNGYYQISVLFGWTGSVSFSKDQYSFSPASWWYPNITSNKENQDTTGTWQGVMISGYVYSDDGSGVQGAAVETSDAVPYTCTTLANGYYELVVLERPWSGTVTVTKTDCDFLPVSRVYTGISVNQSGQNYIDRSNGIINVDDVIGNGVIFTHLQPAINAAHPGDTIIVKDGTYTGTGNYDLDFGGDAITLRSENGQKVVLSIPKRMEEQLFSKPVKPLRQ